MASWKLALRGCSGAALVRGFTRLALSFTVGERAWGIAFRPTARSAAFQAARAGFPAGIPGLTRKPSTAGEPHRR